MNPQFDVAIIGAGFSGLIAAIELHRSGRFSFVVLERGDRVGGVWRENVYPGCACDIRSHLYSISTHSKVDWASNYATQPEILSYLEQIVEHEGLARHLRLGWRVESGRFDEAAQYWRLEGPEGEQITARAIICATGPQDRPQVPSIEGIDQFAGTMCHSSAWQKDRSLVGKNVAVIGTGASAIQIVPEIAAEVKALRVFQRSPTWVLPRGKRNLSAFERAIYRYVPGAQQVRRAAIYWFHELLGTGCVGNFAVRRILEKLALRKLARELPDAHLRQLLTPQFQIGCKRILVSDDYYPAFTRDNVSLVTSPITKIEPGGIRTSDGQFHPIDHIIFATGFNVANADGYLPLTGCGGRQLVAEWLATGAKAYLGITVSGFPNLALLLGPNTGPTHSSAVYMAESQMKYVLQYLDAIAERGRALDVKEHTERTYNDEIQKRLKTTVWMSGCNSWYLDRNGRNTTMYPGITSAYRRRVSRFNRSDYAEL